MKRIVGITALVLVLGLGTAQGLVINETFGTDPGWTRVMDMPNDSQSNFGYNAAQMNIARAGTLSYSPSSGFYVNNAANKTARYAKLLPAPVTEATDFTMAFDYAITGGTGGVFTPGLFKSGANNFNGAAQGFSLYVNSAGASDLFVYTSGGLRSSGWANVILTGHMSIQYVAATKTVTWSFTNSDNAPAAYTFALNGGDTFQADQFGVGNYDLGFDYTYALVNLDNMYLNANLPAAELRGAVTLDGYSGDVSDIAVRVDLLRSGAIVQTQKLLLGTDGSFSIPGVAKSTYDVRLNAGSWLQKVVTGVVVSADPTTMASVTLIGGDLDGSNGVDITDLSIVLTNMDQMGE